MKSNRLAVFLSSAMLVVGFSSQLMSQEGESIGKNPPAPASAAAPEQVVPAAYASEEADCPFGTCEQGVPLLSKLPYISRLFKNVGVGSPRVVRVVIGAETIPAPEKTAESAPATSPEAPRANGRLVWHAPPPSTDNDENVIYSRGPNYVVDGRRLFLSETYWPHGQIGVDFEVVREGGLIKVIPVSKPADAAACSGECKPAVSTSLTKNECACGATCTCCPKLSGNVLKWFTIQTPGVKLPTLTNNPCLAATDSITACTAASGTACTAGVCTAPVGTPAVCSAGIGAVCAGTAAGATTVCTEGACTNGACSAVGCSDVACKSACMGPQAQTAYHGTHQFTFTGIAPHAIAPPPHHAGCPFQGLHEKLVAALTENAYLKGKHETREALTEALVAASVENAKLETQNELFSEFVELKEEMANEKQEFMESVVEMQQEFLQQLTEVHTENARLKVQLELAEEKQKLVGEFVQAQLELSRKSAELQTRAAQVEQQLHAIEQVKAENAALKDRVAELVGEKLQGSFSNPHTATRPTTSTPSAPK